MPVPHSALVAHIRQLTAQTEALRLLIEPPRPPRPRWPYALVAALLLGGCVAEWRLWQPATPPIVAPIAPSGADARDLYLRP